MLLDHSVPTGQDTGVFVALVNLHRGMSASRRRIAGIWPRKPRGSGVNVLHHGVLASLCSSAHKQTCDAAVCKHTIPLCFSHCDVFLIYSVQWFIKKCLKKLQFHTRFVTLVLANCQTSVINESEALEFILLILMSLN